MRLSDEELGHEVLDEQHNKKHSHTCSAGPPWLPVVKSFDGEASDGNGRIEREQSQDKQRGEPMIVSRVAFDVCTAMSEVAGKQSIAYTMESLQASGGDKVR